MKILKTILMVAIWAIVVEQFLIWQDLKELDRRITDIRDTWILATTPVSGIEEIEPEQLNTADGVWIPPEKD